ncbi:MAG: hypothetical protein JNM56_10655 [Planctomycetia bacterium]|nr:hypothetical protein [Planctomycetia bacterium]
MQPQLFAVSGNQLTRLALELLGSSAGRAEWPGQPATEQRGTPRQRRASVRVI